jgi:large subunit ribosomal protein L35
MPKVKTSRSAAKRLRATSSGKIKRNKACKSHKLTTKTRKRKRNLRQGGLVDSANSKRIKRLLPNG